MSCEGDEGGWSPRDRDREGVSPESNVGSRMWPVCVVGMKAMGEHGEVEDACGKSEFRQRAGRPGRRGGEAERQE